MCKAVIFDLDGTIIHSLPDIAFSVNAMLKEFNHPQKNDTLVMRAIGNGARNLVKNLIDEPLSDEEIDIRLKFYNEHYTKSNSPRTSLFDGVDEVITELKKRGFKVAVLTNKPQMTTDDVNKTYLIHLNFDMVIGQQKGLKMKPDPQVLLSMLEKMQVEKENAYMVGDGETDIMTAINANITGISALWGYRTKTQLQDAGAYLFAQSIYDILDIIK